MPVSEISIVFINHRFTIWPCGFITTRKDNMQSEFQQLLFTLSLEAAYHVMCILLYDEAINDESIYTHYSSLTSIIQYAAIRTSLL